MAKRSARQTTTRARKSAAGGGLGVLFGIMAAIVVAVIAVAFLVTGGSDKPAAGPDQPAVTDNTISKPSRKRTDWPDVEPWNGISVGMDRSQIIDKLGPPNAQNVAAYKSEERLEYYNNAERAGIFGDTGGVKLTIYIDTDTNKVVYFVPPKSAEQVIREHEEKRKQQNQ